ncbi:ferredoxin [Mycobacterium sp. ENV421]|uniref:ferredoxin n=1 Tax=Mycobacteriaceae TaxID=1762 RepID=UPI000C9A0A02|nr:MULTISPECIES: ferredoxin [Mycobacteriaceae]PND54510.1 ferredoxin [Mycobacterium sp. ENV421]QSM61157.1 ferredoxin [Mycobacteroides abscessus subsp. abscessus]
MTDRPPVTVSVDKSHCQLYGICQAEAPDVFDLGADGRLRYHSRAAGGDSDAVRQAARCCPTQAITLTERRP